MRGMAAESNLYVVNYQANFLDSATQTYINDGSVQVTNSSYSNGCNDGYTTITQTVDTQANDIPTLLHVFSAGNSNNNDCGYGAGNQWGNITGGHKQGKNVIATANVFFDGSLVGSSSRGPAHDGRIKPDIAANGQNQNSTDENNTYQSFGGTSGAAPGIAGISAQLYEAYGDLNGGNLPPSALIKASLLNTASMF
jgi:subtilisin family serine protease